MRSRSYADFRPSGRPTGIQYDVAFRFENYIWILDKRRCCGIHPVGPAFEDGEVVGITPDGPKGPRMRANSGVVSLAKVAGAPIMPLTFAVLFRMYSEVGIVLSCRCRLAGRISLGRSDLCPARWRRSLFRRETRRSGTNINSAYAAGGLVDGPPGYRSGGAGANSRLNEYECPLGISTTD